MKKPRGCPRGLFKQRRSRIYRIALMIRWTKLVRGSTT